MQCIRDAINRKLLDNFCKGAIAFLGVCQWSQIGKVPSCFPVSLLWADIPHKGGFIRWGSLRQEVEMLMIAYLLPSKEPRQQSDHHSDANVPHQTPACWRRCHGDNHYISLIIVQVVFGWKRLWAQNSDQAKVSSMVSTATILRSKAGKYKTD